MTLLCRLGSALRGKVNSAARVLLIGSHLAAGSVVLANDADKAEEFAPGDVLRVLTFGREDLTGKFMVQSGRVVSLPLLGPVNLSARTPRELEVFLAKAWEQRLGAPQSVTVEFLERAPFYILGAVKNPGAYPYRPGLTAMQAIAIGGGVHRDGAGDPRVRFEVFRERERRARAVEAMAEALAERARLEAERSNAKEVKTPQELRDLGSSGMVEALMLEQSRLFQARLDHFNKRLALLNEQVRLSAEEIATYQKQHEALRRQEDLITRELERVQKLRDTGLGLQSRVFEMQQRLSALSADMIAVLGGVARARSGLASAQSSMGQLREERQKDVAEALIVNERKIREASLVELSSRKFLTSAGQAISGADLTPELRLIRADATEATLVGPTAAVRPGDVLELWLPPDRFETRRDPINAPPVN